MSASDTPRDLLAAFDALIAAHDTASGSRRGAIRECSREIDAALDRLRKLAEGWR